MNVVDLFCGTGGISYGLQLVDRDFKTVAGIDIDSAACETARANHPAALIVEAAVGDVDPLDLVLEAGCGEVDVLVGGPPCQGFSSLRPSRGTTLDDPRNVLYRDYAHYVASLRPKVFLLENVVGIVNAIKGHLLPDLLAAFESAGYETDWRILNAASFGVPQKRERFFLVGVRKDVLGNRRVEFPPPTHSFTGRTIGIRDKRRMLVADADLPPALTAWRAISDLPSLGSAESAHLYETEPQNEYQSRMRTGVDALTLHEAANHGSKMQNVMRLAGANKSALPEGLVTSGYSSCYSRIEPHEPAPTITVKFTSPASSKCIHPFDNRSITPREAARLQGFPDSFTFRGSKTQIASQIGNAVPPLLAAHFAPILERYIA